MGKLQFKEANKRRFYASHTGVISGALETKWDDTPLGEPIPYSVLGMGINVDLSHYYAKLKAYFLNGRGTTTCLNVSADQYSSYRQDPCSYQSWTIPLRAGSGTPIFEAVTGKFAYGEGDGDRLRECVRLPKNRLRNIAQQIWECCASGADRVCNRARLFARIMCLAEARELVDWCIDRAAKGTLPSCFVPYRPALQPVSLAATDMVLIEASERIKDMFDLDGDQVVLVAPLFDKLSGSFLERAAVREVYARSMTPAFIVVRTVSNAAKVGYSVYLADECLGEPIYYFSGRGEPQERKDVILGRLHSLVCEQLLGESNDDALATVLESEYRKLCLVRMSQADIIAYYQYIKGKIDRLVGFEARIGVHSTHDLSAETARIFVKAFTQIYGVGNENS